MQNNEDSFSFMFQDLPDKMFARFLLPNNDTVTIDGNSVDHIFFEVNRKFPEGFPCKAIGFSGKDKKESSDNLKRFLEMSKNYGQL